MTLSRLLGASFVAGAVLSISSYIHFGLAPALSADTRGDFVFLTATTVSNAFTQCMEGASAVHCVGRLAYQIAIFPHVAIRIAICAFATLFAVAVYFREPLYRRAKLLVRRR